MKDDRYLLGGLEVLLDAMSGKSTGDSIIDQESRGQKSFVMNNTLPHKFNHCTKEQFEEMGIVFGKEIDDLFSEIILPDGWEKVATDHNMWSILIDDKGRKRASIFYKAAFYDRDAFLDIERRFTYGCCPINGWENYNNEDSFIGTVLDGKEVIWTSDELLLSLREDADIHEKEEHWKTKDKLAHQAKKWLNYNYPKWENPLAYWD